MKALNSAADVGRKFNIMKKELFSSQCYSKGPVEPFHFGICQMTNIIGKKDFWKADQIVTINSAIVFKPFFNTYINLGGNLIIFCVNRSADNCGEIGINKLLSGNNHENTIFFGIVFTPLMDTKKIAAFHSIPSKNMFWYESTSIASWLSLSAFLLIISMSLSPELFTGNLIVTFVRPLGTSRGTEISKVSRRLSVTSTVCVIVMLTIYIFWEEKAIFRNGSR